MRLIDKDRLLKGSNHYWLEMENFGDIESIDVRFIEMAEEVKAIPVEWIDNYLSKWKNAETHDVAKTWWLIMQREWEKENDKDI